MNNQFYDPWGSNVSVDERLKLIRGHIATDRPIDLIYLRQLRAHPSVQKQPSVIKAIDAKMRRLDRIAQHFRKACRPRLAKRKLLPAPNTGQRRSS